MINTDRFIFEIFTSLVFVLIVTTGIFLLVGTECIGYVFGYSTTITVGPFDTDSEPTTWEEGLAWKCAGFKQKPSGQWGYVKVHDHNACRRLKRRCEDVDAASSCNNFRLIQENKIGWGKDQALWHDEVEMEHVPDRVLLGEDLPVVRNLITALKGKDSNKINAAYADVMLSISWNDPPEKRLRVCSDALQAIQEYDVSFLGRQDRIQSLLGHIETAESEINAF